MIDRNIIDILACPSSHRALRPLPATRLDRLNEKIRSERCNYVDGTPVQTPLSEGLITDNGTLIYRIDDDMPVLLIERGIAARQIDDP